MAKSVLREMSPGTSTPGSLWIFATFRWNDLPVGRPDYPVGAT